MIEIEAPDGSVVEFPDGTPDMVMRDAMRRKFPAPGTSGPQTPNIAAKGDMVPGSRVQPDLHGKFVQGATLNSADEIASGLGAPVHAAFNAMTGEGPRSVRENYEQSQARLAAERAATEEAYPKASIAAEIGGALATAPFSGGARLLATGNKLVKAGKAAAAGAGYGGVAGFMSGDGLEDRVDKAKSGAKWGAGLGVAVPTVAAGVGKVAGKLLGDRAKTAATVDELRDIAGAEYRAAEAGVGKSKVAFPADFNRLRRSFNAIAEKNNMGGAFGEVIDKTYPSSKAFLNAINNFNGPSPNFTDMERMRQLLREVVEDNRTIEGLKPDGFMARNFIDALDTYVGATPFKKAREAWRTMKKAEEIADAFWRADLRTSANYSQAGMETAIKQEFKRLAMDGARFVRTFDKPEQEAILKVIHGGGIQNFMRRFGSWAPQTAGIKAMLHGGVAFAEPFVGVPTMIAAAAARHGSTAKTLSNARKVQELVAGTKPGSSRYENLASEQAGRLLLPLSSQSDPSAMRSRENPKPMAR